MTDKREGTKFLHYFGPLLDALRALGGSATPEEATDKVAELCSVTDAQQNELLDSGQPRFRNQVHWARFYLKRAGLVDSSRRGVWSLTEKGKSAKLNYDGARAIFYNVVKLDTEARKGRKAKLDQRVDRPKRRT